MVRSETRRGKHAPEGGAVATFAVVRVELAGAGVPFLGRRRRVGAAPGCRSGEGAGSSGPEPQSERRKEPEDGSGEEACPG